MTTTPDPAPGPGHGSGGGACATTGAPWAGLLSLGLALCAALTLHARLPGTGPQLAARADLALTLATTAVIEAENWRSLWLATPALLGAAREARLAGRNGRSVRLAREARTQALLALNQVRLEMVRETLEREGSEWPAQLRARLESRLRRHDGLGAWTLLPGEARRHEAPL